MPPKRNKKGAKAAGGHQLAAAVSIHTEMKDLRKKTWVIGEAIGSGGFGLIYLADASKENASKEKAQYVVKVEPVGNGPLFCEIAFYQRAAKAEILNAWRKRAGLPYVGVPAYIAHGLHKTGQEDLRFMVMPRFGSDLQNLWEKANKRFSRQLVCQLAIQLINSLEYMHDNEYVHADVKGGNVLLGHSDPSQIYLVDFGLAYRYLVDGKHKEYKEDPRKAHDGTIEYTSRDAHKGVAPSRRSDLEILGYVLLHWVSGSLPWENKLSDKNYVKDQKIKHMADVKKFVASVYPEATSSKAVEFEKFLQYVSNLQYDEKPDYKLIRKYFADALKSMGVAAKEKIDFGKEPAPGSTRKRQSQPKAAKPLQSASQSQNSLSDESSDGAPKQKRRAVRQRKQAVVSEEISTTTTTESDIDNGRQIAKKQTKPRSVKKNARQRILEESSEESSEDENFQPAVKVPVRRSKRTSNQDESLAKSHTAGSSIDETTSSEGAISKAKMSSGRLQKQSKPQLNARYSMAPLHTESVLGKDDKLTGEYSGKHPVIIRRRKKKRPKTDAVTQTTPGLHQRSTRSRV